MLGFLRLIFAAIRIIGVIFILIYVYMLFVCIRQTGLKQNVFKIVHNNTMPASKIFTVITYCVMVFALIEGICSIVFRSDEIGSFYEASTCYETRECIVDYWGQDVYGLAVIRKENELRNSFYYIDALYLPHGLSFFQDDCLIDIKDEVHDFNFDTQSLWVEWDITLHSKATSASLIALENSLIHDKGEFCTIPSSNVFHRTTCRHVKKSSSLIYIEDAYEAFDIFDLTPCEICCDDSIWD